MPAILIEAGFMTNLQENNLLKSDQYRKIVARAVVKGIAQTYNLQPKTKPAAAKPAAAAPIKKQVGGVDSMTQYYNPPAATKQATINLLKEWEKLGLHSMHRENLEKGSLTLEQAIGLLYVAHERGYIK